MSDQKQNRLERGLKNRHIQMIALGGAIGTGLFYGSGKAISMTGPSVIIAFSIGGLLMYLVMRMLGEMTTQEPVAGAFSHFAYKYWCEFAGFFAGWNYWILYVLVSMAELTVAGDYVKYWFPNFPPWMTSLIVLIAITLTNLINVRFYGEFEFYFTLLKVSAILFLISVGSYLILFGFHGEPLGFSNLWQYGFMPNGLWGLASSCVVVTFAFGGTELIGIAAGEADDPRKSIPKAVNQIVWRILMFYVGALIVILSIYPWNQIAVQETLETSPFVLIFNRIGIPSAAHIMNFVVLSAALSVYNSGIYSNGRMLYALAEQGNAPSFFKRLGANRVPVFAILFSSLCTLVIVVINYLIPDRAFMRIMTIASVSALTTWGLIVIVHFFFRRKMVETKQEIYFKSFLFPYTNVLVLSCFVFLGYILWMNGEKIPVMLAPIWIALMWVIYKVKKFLSK